MMCWNWIDSSRKREAHLVSRTRHTVPSAVHGRAWTKNCENKPMQSRVNTGSQHSCCAASGREKKNAPSSWPQPNLIPLYIFLLSMISGQTLRVCPEGKPVPTHRVVARGHAFPDHAEKPAQDSSVGATSRTVWTSAAISGVIGSRCGTTSPIL